MRDAVAIVLGGGRGTRLLPLTQYRSKPAVPLAGKYRLIDIPLSNCINSGVNRIYLLTQFMSVSLHRHIRQTYRFDPFSGGFVEVLAAQQTMETGTDWYQGTADAVRKHLKYFTQPGVKHVIILSGDQLYRMDYGDMLRTHLESKADITIAAMPVSRNEVSALGVMKCDETGRVIGFKEKPKTLEEVDAVAMEPAWIDQRGVASRGRECLASMGIYLFRADVLRDRLSQTDYQDFGREVFPESIQSHKVQVHLFDGYWEDIGTIKAFYDANLMMASHDPAFQMVHQDAPIYSRARFLPPSQMEDARVRNSIIADGCRIGRNVTIENSVVGLRCQIGNNVTVRNSIIMGADMYESDQFRDLNGGMPPLGIGSDCVIEGAIIDKNCRIAGGAQVIAPAGENFDHGVECAVRDGIPVIVKDAALPGNWRLP